MSDTQMSQTEAHEWSYYKRAPFMMLSFSLCITRAYWVLQGAKILTQEIVEEMALAADGPLFVLLKPWEGTGRLST